MVSANAQYRQAAQRSIAPRLLIKVIAADTVAPEKAYKIALLHQQRFFAAGHALQRHVACQLPQLGLRCFALGRVGQSIHIFLQQ